MADAKAAIYMHLMNQRYGDRLEQIPRAAWAAPARAMQAKPIEVWRSRDFLVMVWLEPNGYTRLSMVRTSLDGGRYADGISWDDLQRLKAETGRGDVWAVEVYPPDSQIVNVQNMRHIFILPEPPPYGWKDKNDAR